MTSTELVTVRSFDHRAQADMLLLQLQSAGISAHLSGDHIVGRHWTLANAAGGCKVQVQQDQYDQAMHLVESLKQVADDADDESDGEDQCLACGVAMPEAGEACDACGWTYLDGSGE